MPRFRRLAAVAFMLVLTSTWVVAAPRHETRRSPGEVTAAASPAGLLLSRVWQWLSAAWSKAGAGSDPSGGKPGAPPPPAGSNSDPSGCPCGS
jgi:hypothetical protein